MARRQQARPQQVHPNTRAKEDGDTYVYLRRSQPPRTADEVVGFAVFDVGQNRLDHIVREYHLLQNNMPHDLMYRLRFPALMFMQSRQTLRWFHNDCQFYFEDRTKLRSQFGTHLFVAQYGTNTYAQIETIPTMYRGAPPHSAVRPYGCRRCSLISAVYPCYKPGPNHHAQNNPNDLDMVLGMCFVPDNGAAHQEPRTFSRFRFNNPNPITQFAFDIPESFIDMNAQPPAGGAFWNNFQSRDVGLAMFPMLPDHGIDQFHNAVAFYVCRGARLVVRDTRFSNQAHLPDQLGIDPVTGLPLPYQHCRSLYLEGSLCVVKGNEIMGVNINLPGQANLFYDFPFTPFLESHLIPNRSQDLLDNVELGLDNDPLLPQQTLGNLKNKVIFLGAVESQLNSVCWSLDVERQAPGLHSHKFTLSVPEGGVITDISSWRAGFRQIYWRHKYERLYESVLSPLVPQQPQAFHFQVPDDYNYRRMIGLPNDQVRQNRPTNAVSLHINANANAQTDIPHPPNNNFDNGPTYDRDVRKYMFHPQLWQHPPQDLAGVDVRLKHVECYKDVPDWPNNLQWPVPTPPLYPPIKVTDNQDENVFKLVYLAQNEKVVSVKGTNNKYGKYFQTWQTQKFYELRKTEKPLAYPWSSCLENVANKIPNLAHKTHVLTYAAHQQEAGQWTRLGMDYLDHYKWGGCRLVGRGRAGWHHNHTIQSKIKTWYLKEVDATNVQTPLVANDWNKMYF